MSARGLERRRKLDGKADGGPSGDAEKGVSTVGRQV
jgi:hypothetical protein